MHGAEGWYGYAPGPYNSGVLELFHLTRSTQDRARAGSAIDHPWLAYLDGRDPSWPERALEADLAHIDTRLARMAADHSKPEARLADNALEINPAAVTALLHQTVGAIHIARPPWAPSTPNAGGAPLYSRLRHFDPVRRRAGLPEDVAALVEAMSDRGVVLTLVNSGAVARRVTVQAGGYGEHRFSSLRVDGRAAPIDGRVFTLTLAPGAVARVEAGMQLHVNQPTLAFPWDRSA